MQISTIHLNIVITEYFPISVFVYIWNLYLSK